MSSTTEKSVRINRYLPRTRVEGPGERAAVWVQGCPIHCEGCATPELWDPAGGEEVEVGDLAERVLATGGLEGITLTGGEPFEQASSLAALLRLIRPAGLSVVTFSGYTFERLRAGEDPAWADLLSLTDLLLDGPFQQENFDLSRPWVGSSNQGFRFLTPRYASLEGHLQEIPNKVEVRLTPEGLIRVNGMADFKKLKKLLATQQVPP